MVTNNILLSLNKNRKAMSDYETQLSTGKKIQKPSDDPIIAARTLKFRTNISEISQYKTNAEDAINWIDTTEKAVSNTMAIMQRMRELSVQGGSDVLSSKNKEGILEEIGQLSEQLVTEGNISYAGRYMFSGYKTDMPLYYEEDSTDSFEITETFASDQVETVSRAFNNNVNEVSRIRLGYSGTNAFVSSSLSPALTANPALASTDPGAYEPAAGTYNYLQDTGEIILNDDDLAGLPASFDIVYEKDTFKKGDMRPEHYFESENLATGATYSPQEEAMEYQVSYSQTIQVNTMGHDLFNVDFNRDIQEMAEAAKNILYDGTVEDDLKQEILSNQFSAFIGQVDVHIQSVSNEQSVIGAKINRLNLTLNRLDEDELNFTDLLSNTEDVDMAEAYIKLSSQEAVFQAALNASGRIIQPNLLDFIR